MAGEMKISEILLSIDTFLSPLSILEPMFLV